MFPQFFKVAEYTSSIVNFSRFISTEVHYLSNFIIYSDDSSPFIWRWVTLRRVIGNIQEFGNLSSDCLRILWKFQPDFSAVYDDDVFPNLRLVLVKLLIKMQNGWLDLCSPMPFAIRSHVCGLSVGSMKTKRDVSVVSAIFDWEYSFIEVFLHDVIRLRRLSALSILYWLILSPFGLDVFHLTFRGISSARCGKWKILHNIAPV